MKTTQLTKENIDKYSAYLDPDDAENIGREYYNAVVVENESGDPEAGAIWEIKALEDEESDIISEISWIDVDGSEAGKTLFDEYALIIRDDQVSESRFEISKENCENADELMRSNGFETKEHEGRKMIVTVADLKKLDALKLDKKIPSYVHPLSDISEWEFKRGLISCIFQSKRTLVQDLCSLPMDWYETDISCYVETDGRADGFLLVHTMASGKLRIELFINSGPDPLTELFHMARFSVRKAIELYDDDMEIVVFRRDISSVKLSHHLFPNKKGERVFTGHRKEEV